MYCVVFDPTLHSIYVLRLRYVNFTFGCYCSSDMHVCQNMHVARVLYSICSNNGTTLIYVLFETCEFFLVLIRGAFMDVNYFRQYLF